MLSVNEYKKIIKARMGDYRYTHSVNVSKEARKLAKLYGADEEKAAIAGILHDITKETPKDEQLQIILDGGIILDSIQMNAPKLWHSISGSVYVQKELGIEDEDILNAIKYHTTGRAGMTLLEKIIFIADFTSEERDYKGVSTMRKKSRKSLEEAMLYGFKFTFSDLSKRELAIHPDELHCYNEIVLQNLSVKGKGK
ncbi:MAG: bis(5'-nucleosyl)-tetraphosphatase (symmetrical) YqeK [Ruminococcus sp.]|nr:bis(5'-nucleosyl)-tetraphosphatase (symmetrical) YqeK [Ruminococcus sp.]